MRSGQKTPWPRAVLCSSAVQRPVQKAARKKTWAAGLVSAARQAATRLGPSLPTPALALATPRVVEVVAPGARTHAVAPSVAAFLSLCAVLCLCFPPPDDPRGPERNNDDYHRRRHTVRMSSPTRAVTGEPMACLVLVPTSPLHTTVLVTATVRPLLQAVLQWRRDTKSG